MCVCEPGSEFSASAAAGLFKTWAAFLAVSAGFAGDDTSFSAARYAFNSLILALLGLIFGDFTVAAFFMVVFLTVGELAVFMPFFTVCFFIAFLSNSGYALTLDFTFDFAILTMPFAFGFEILPMPLIAFMTFMAVFIAVEAPSVLAADPSIAASAVDGRVRNETRLSERWH